MSPQKRQKRPAPCAACQTVTAELMLHKEMRDGIVVRERICTDCYFRALKNAIADGDMSWARLNNQVQAIQDTIREREAQQRENAWRSDPATDKQIAFLQKLAAERRREIEPAYNLTKGEASQLIDSLQETPIPRACSCCGREFGVSPNAPNRKYCDGCIKLTPAQRRKLASPINRTVH